MLLRALILCAPVALAACGERVVADDPTPAYTLQEVAYAAADRDLRVEIHGDPFGGDPRALEQAIPALMQNRILGVDTRFTTTPGPTALPGYRVVLVFNMAQTSLNSTLCRSGPIATKPAGRPAVVQGAFCRGGGALTSATGWLDEPTTPDDPAFRHLIADMTYSLFPSRQADSCGGPDC